MSRSSVDLASLRNSTATLDSSGSVNNQCFAPRKRRYYRSREHFNDIKINLFNSLAYDVSGECQTESPPTRCVC